MSDKQELSLKDIYIVSLKAWKFLLSKWLIILIVGIASGILGFVYAYNSKPTYKASINFVLSNNTTQAGGLLGIANQFGIDLGSSNTGAFTGDNIITLMKSRRMVQKALFGKTNNDKSLINLYVENNKLKESWEKNERTKSAYPFPENDIKMTMIQDSLVRDIYTSIVKGNVLDISQPDKNQSIYVVTTNSSNEVFSYYLTKYLVDSTSAFYISTKTSVAKQNLEMLQREADSIKNVLGGQIRSAGSQADFTYNLNPAYQVKRSGVLQSQADATALGQAYGQVLQNLELAKITLLKETPLYQIIDEPTLPLQADKPSKLIFLIIGGIIGGVVICGFLILKKFLARLKR